jgi:hypothetical protein
MKDNRTFGDKPDPASNGVELDTLGDALSAEELQDLMKQAGDSAEEELVGGTRDFLNRLIDIDPEFATMLVSGRIKVPQTIVDAADGELIPFNFARLPGGHTTSVLGIINALLRWLGCTNSVAAHVAVVAGKARDVKQFSAWFDKPENDA